MNGFSWMNPPLKESICEKGLEIVTKNETDFWQRTHYGFCRDDGHFLFKEVTGDFELSGHFTFNSNTQYDQCGILIRVDSDNWVKASIEFEDEQFSHLGSVVTNFGYSDWSTQVVTTEHKSIWFSATRTGKDFIIRHSFDNKIFHQMRVLHLHEATDQIKVGAYACSPKREGFTCVIHSIEIKQ